MRRGSIESWLLSTYSVSNSLAENKSIKDRILLEDVPSGREYLDPILEAMKKNRFIHIAYYNYWREDIEVLEPLWLRKEITGKIKRMWNKYNKEEQV